MEIKDVWDDCIRMWEWICDELPNNWTPDDSINRYKLKYVKKFNVPMCSFCAYGRWKTGYKCGNCPGRLVDPDFSCFNREYSFEERPYEFLAKLKELYPYEKRIILFLVR